MKKAVMILLPLLLLFLLSSAAFADSGVDVELMTVDGVSVVVLTPASGLSRADAAAENAPGFFLPQSLTNIAKSAFEGIDAEVVEISENVTSIGYRAFAGCAKLREFHIPASVTEIDKDALAGCGNVTVYGSTDTAKNFAEAAGFAYVDQSTAWFLPPEEPPVILPPVKR